MNALIRWGKFCLVGVIGTVVQLGSLALFSHWMHRHYLYASAAATEITLIHNFIWHWMYTWRDRLNGSGPFRRFMMFQLSNGFISLGGNLLLMRIFVYECHLPLLLSNLSAILACSLANFCLGNNWAFAETRQRAPIELLHFEHRAR